VTCIDGIAADGGTQRTACHGELIGEDRHDLPRGPHYVHVILAKHLHLTTSNVIHSFQRPPLSFIRRPHQRGRSSALYQQNFL
jgi:hypothetical protein